MRLLIPKHHRKMLRSIGHRHLRWYQIEDWAMGERYKFKNGTVAYLLDGEIITIRKGANIIWRL